MPNLIIARPESTEFDPYYANYINGVPGDDAFTAMRNQIRETVQMLQSLPESQAAFRYAPDKWSINEVIGHMCDAERIMSYRALRIARADATPLSGFEQDDYVKAADFDTRALASLLEEFQSIRAATIAFFGSLDETALRRSGTANNAGISVRALAYIIAGHERHHVQILRERYGVK